MIITFFCYSTQLARVVAQSHLFLQQAVPLAILNEIIFVQFQREPAIIAQ
jgi:hypothetical protein